MKISFDPATFAQLLPAIHKSIDAETLGGDEYALDLYDNDPPISLEMQLNKDGVDVLAAAELSFDDALDGWYLSDRIESPEIIKSAILAWLASAESGEQK